MELDAIKKVRGEMGLTNVEIMIPFVRTLDMAKDPLWSSGSEHLKPSATGDRVCRRAGTNK
eukprot:2813176-Amphidinium_carterae.1